MDLAKLKEGYEAFNSNSPDSGDCPISIARDLDPQQLAGFAIAYFAAQPGCDLDAMRCGNLPQGFYRLLDQAMDRATDGSDGQYRAFIAASLWQFGELMLFDDGAMRATTASKKIIARAFSQAPAFNDNFRRILIETLSDAAQPARETEDFAGLPKYIDKCGLQSILDYIELSHTPLGGFASRRKQAIYYISAQAPRPTPNAPSPIRCDACA